MGERVSRIENLSGRSVARILYENLSVLLKVFNGSDVISFLFVYLWSNSNSNPKYDLSAAIVNMITKKLVFFQK